MCSSTAAFAAPSPVRPRLHSGVGRNRKCAAVRARRTAAAPLMLRREGRSQPDYSAGWTPDHDAAYVEVRVLSVSAHGREGCLITLAPVGGRRAFRMAVTPAAADAVRAAASNLSSARPGTLELAHTALAAAGALVTRAAITHVRADVFIARIWTRAALDEHSHDARPSDAIALALRAAAPLYLNTTLLTEWGVPVADVLRDARAGLCEIVAVHPGALSASALRAEARAAPEHVALAKLRAALDMAVRLQRFREATALRNAIDAICPADKLERKLEQAIRAQNFDEAAKLRDQVVLWRARQRRWERGGLQSSIFGKDLPDIIQAASQEDAIERVKKSLYGEDGIEQQQPPPREDGGAQDKGNSSWFPFDRGMW